jgi:dihydrofolate synthase/folylpolyglutamate synthase
VVSAAQEPEVAEILIALAQEVGTTPAFEGNEFAILRREVAVGGQQLALRGLGGVYDEIFLPLHGPHQGHNAALALAAVEAFLGGGEHRLDLDVIRAGLAGATSPGRLEVVRRSPTVLVDAAHNPAGARALRAALEDSFNFAKVVGVVAILEDKNASLMLEILEPVLNEIVVSRTTSPRAINPERLGQLAMEIYGESRVTVIENLPDALDKAAEIADEGGFGGGVLATGSITTAAEIRMLLGVTSG